MRFDTNCAVSIFGASNPADQNAVEAAAAFNDANALSPCSGGKKKSSEAVSGAMFQRPWERNGIL